MAPGLMPHAHRRCLHRRDRRTNRPSAPPSGPLRRTPAEMPCRGSSAMPPWTLRFIVGDHEGFLFRLLWIPEEVFLTVPNSEGLASTRTPPLRAGKILEIALCAPETPAAATPPKSRKKFAKLSSRATCRPRAVPYRSDRSTPERRSGTFRSHPLHRSWKLSLHGVARAPFPSTSTNLKSKYYRRQCVLVAPKKCFLDIN